MLKDTETFAIINKDPTNKLTKEMRELLTRWKSKGYITNNTYNAIYCSDDNLPCAYELPKIHKPGHTFQIIILSIDSPLYSAGFIHKIISKIIVKPLSYIENSYQVVKKLNGREIGENYDLISLDVVSLFISIII